MTLKELAAAILASPETTQNQPATVKNTSGPSNALWPVKAFEENSIVIDIPTTHN